jgi:hypothetical protein
MEMSTRASARGLGGSTRATKSGPRMGISRTGGPGTGGWVGWGWVAWGWSIGLCSQWGRCKFPPKSNAQAIWKKRARSRPSGFPTERAQHTSRALENSNRVPKLLDDEYSNMSDDEGGATRDLNGIKYFYCDKTWKKESFEYVPPWRTFTGCGGPTFQALYGMPTFIMFFCLFWPNTYLHKICTKTNRYATTIDGDGNAPCSKNFMFLGLVCLLSVNRESI